MKKIAYISIKGTWGQANEVSSILPEISTDAYLMLQIKKMKLYPIKNKDFIIASTKQQDLEKAIIELYNKNVRMFITTAITSQLTEIQNIITKNNMDDAFVFDTGSTANLPRSGNNIFRYSTIDATAKNELLYLFSNVLKISAMISDGSPYAINMVNMLKPNGVVLIEPINGNYEAIQFDNYNIIFLLAENNNLLIKLNNVAKNFNSPKVLYLSDTFNFTYNNVIIDTVQNLIVETNMKSYSTIFSWSSSHVSDYFKLSKIIFDGKIVNTLLLDSLTVLDFVFNTYIAQDNCGDFDVVYYMFSKLKQIGIIYTTNTNLYGIGDHITINYMLTQVSLPKTSIEWSSPPINYNTQVTRYPDTDAFLSMVIDPARNPASSVQGLDTLIIGNNTFAYFTNDVIIPQVRSIIYMVSLPNDYTVELTGRVYMINIKFNIFKSKLDGNNSYDEIIRPINFSYVFDTTWFDKLRPNVFDHSVNKIYYTDYIIIDDLDIYYDVILDTNNNNLLILFKTNINEYYIFTSEVEVNSVYPKLTNSGDFRIKYSQYLLPNESDLTEQQIIDIADFSQNFLFPKTI